MHPLLALRNGDAAYYENIGSAQRAGEIDNAVRATVPEGANTIPAVGSVFTSPFKALPKRAAVVKVVACTLAVAVVAGSGIGLAVVLSSVTSPTPQNKNVGVIPFQTLIADNENGRRLSQCANLHSSISCSTSSGQRIDITPYYEFATVIGTGYNQAMGWCSGQPFVTGPYATSHAGGLLVNNYDHINSNAIDQTNSFIRSAIGTDKPTLSDIVHDGAYDYTCKNGYLHNGINYTCGLQYLRITGTFRGSECYKLRPETIDPDDHSPWNMFAFKKDADLSDELMNLTAACFKEFGSLEVFPLIKIMNGMDLNDAFFNVTLLVKSSDRGSFTANNLKSLTNVSDLSDSCSLSVVVQIGSPGCDDDVINTNAEFIRDVPSADEVALYELDKFGFEFDSTAKIWHRQNATGCSKGCCDECFQWYCPYDNRPTPTYECKQYTYSCRPGSSHNNSSDQQCGVVDLDDAECFTDDDGVGKCIDSLRC